MNPNARIVQRQLYQAWDAIRLGVQTMYASSTIKPANAVEVFDYQSGTDENEVKFNIRPILFVLPEKGNRPAPNLYVVIKGWLSFEGPDFKATPLRTKNFGTEVAYFRFKKGAVDHVYGAHYDIDEKKAGHPVFHAQISGKPSFIENVNAHLHQTFVATDKVTPILANVRTPSAQMDVFSVIAQLCADHLIWEQSGDEAKNSFIRMRSATSFFIGAAHRLDYLRSDIAATCYRSTHWYAGVT